MTKWKLKEGETYYHAYIQKMLNVAKECMEVDKFEDYDRRIG